MEETKPSEKVQQAYDPNPPSTAQPPSSDPPPPHPQPPPPPAEKSKKRPLENGNTQIMNSKYLKMRLIVRDLRPHIIEVLQTPDFRNCGAAREIQESKLGCLISMRGETLIQNTGFRSQCDTEMKLLMEPYKEMADGNIPAQSQPLSGDGGVRQTQKTQIESRTLLGVFSEKQQTEDKETPGSYIVGGSAFGWNFITFTGSTPAYYGVTKESFLAAQVELEER